MKQLNFPSTPSLRSATNRCVVITSFGFTLIELLIAAAIGGVILVGGARVIVSNIKAEASQESVRRLRDTWGRINYLMDTEIGEASTAVVSGSTLTLTLPNGSTIAYSRSGTDLQRTGPPINDNGSLGAGSGTSTLAENVSSFTPSAANSRDPVYTMTLTDSRGTTYTGLSSAARTRIQSYPTN
ncbi:type II secretion system protein J [Cyanobium sp. ATX 6F1]|uniref:PulJ/GspJ family protein n=1 Tax=unclassified Cyanobium TaxID=2627006 RepID=UPI0020CB7A03|nr:prepilin-type N-terminal cleavage/methylation domain-containing protein [Cyanobium sp. ATX 6F1]MCP9915182.1 prepilin-type N-terminal cleavage/methylation domain-containing protein [Cyanobium sp. ATX 6F1]